MTDGKRRRPPLIGRLKPVPRARLGRIRPAEGRTAVAGQGDAAPGEER